MAALRAITLILMLGDSMAAFRAIKLLRIARGGEFPFDMRPESLP